MSVRVMSWVWSKSRSAPTQRLVLLAIADCANDRGSDAYPSTETLATKTGLSVRGVRKAVADLVKSGELRVDYKAGPKGCNRYRVVIPDPAPDAGNPEQNAPSTDTRHTVHSASDAGSTRNVVPGTRHETTGNPARGAAEPSENRPPTEPSKEPSVPRKRGSDRGTRIPDDFAATAEMIVWAKENTPLVGSKETAAFVDYWRGRAGASGRKTDWVATWRNWMRRAQTEAEAKRPGSRDLVEVNGHRLKPETAQRLADRARFAAMDEANARAAIEGRP